MNFDAQERALLGQLADVLIPAGEGMPSASEAGVAAEGLDAVVAVRPDLIECLKTVLKAAAGRWPAEFVSEIQRNDTEKFCVLAEFVPAAYFLNPKVRAAIAYAGQTPKPIDPRPDYLEEGLLQSVIDRGPIYRPTPPQG